MQPARLRDIAKGTGDWFHNDPVFKRWESSENGLLWINGIRELNLSRLRAGSSTKFLSNTLC